MAVLTVTAAAPPPSPSEEAVSPDAYVRFGPNCLVASDTWSVVSICHGTPAAPTPPAKPSPMPVLPRPAPPPPTPAAPPPPPPPVVRAAPQPAALPPDPEPSHSPTPAATPHPHRAAYHQSLAAPPAQGHPSPVTLMLVLTAPAVLAAAALRPRSGGRSR